MNAWPRNLPAEARSASPRSAHSADGAAEPPPHRARRRSRGSPTAPPTRRALASGSPAPPPSPHTGRAVIMNSPRRALPARPVAPHGHIHSTIQQRGAAPFPVLSRPSPPLAPLSSTASQLSSAARRRRRSPPLPAGARARRLLQLARGLCERERAPGAVGVARRPSAPRADRALRARRRAARGRRHRRGRRWRIARRHRVIPEVTITSMRARHADARRPGRPAWREHRLGCGRLARLAGWRRPAWLRRQRCLSSPVRRPGAVAVVAGAMPSARRVWRSLVSVMSPGVHSPVRGRRATESVCRGSPRRRSPPTRCGSRSEPTRPARCGGSPASPRSARPRPGWQP